MAEQNPATGETETTNRRGDTLTTLLMLTAAAAAIGGFGFLFSMWWQAGISDQYEILRIASQEFVSGRTIIAGDLAETVDLEEEQTPPTEEEEEVPSVAAARAMEAARAERAEWLRLQNFLIGAGKVARAEAEADTRQRRRMFYEAIPFLMEAEKEGFPAGRQTEGNRLLGESLFQVGRFDESAAAFAKAIERDPILERQLLPRLAKAQLESVQPMSGNSLATIERYLDNPSLEVDQQREGQLIRIGALLRLKRWQEAQNAIDQLLAIAPTSDLARQAQEAVFRDKLRLLQAVRHIRQAMQRFANKGEEDRAEMIAYLAPTISDLTDLQREASPTTASQARLWSARAYLIQGMPDEALTGFTVVRQQRPFGAEGIVGGLEEIELLARQGRGVEMLQTTRFVMRELGDPQGFDASMISFEEFRRRLTDAIDELRRQGEFVNAIDAARSLPPVFSLSEALMQEGLGFQEWAAATIADGTDIGGEVARSASILARKRYRAAGDAFAEAAKLEFTTQQYLPTQWSAIDAYQKGRHFSHSIELLEPYLRYEQRRRRPRGLVAYGRALLAVGDAAKAIDALTNCIVEFPRDPLRYDARLLAALAHAELGDINTAKGLLMDNLQDGELTPRSPAYRDSLLTLGELLYRRGYENHLIIEQSNGPEKLELLRANQPILEEAVRRLDQGVARYWPLPRAEAAAYLSARAHLLAAQLPRIEEQAEEVEVVKRALRATADTKLRTALDGFIALRKHLADREEEQRLPLREQTMLRNCFLAEADTLREMNRLEDAATAYRTVSLRYMNEPPALEAILGQARCAKDLGRDRESQLLIRHANIVLQRIPNEWNGSFAKMTRFDRDGWEKLLTWMNDRINNASAGAS